MAGTPRDAGLCVVRRGEVADAAVLAELGARLFVQAYGPTHPEPELTRYLSRAFDPAILSRALSDPSVCLLVVDAPDGGPIGYAWLSHGDEISRADLPEWACAKRPLEIDRFYVEETWHGRGVAPLLMAACIDEARLRGAGVLWLAVWQEAPRPQRFYARMGFRVVGATTFHFGARIDHDHVMLREVEPLAHTTDSSVGYSVGL